MSKSLVAAIACAALLSGCLVPEKFASDIDVKSTGAYSFSYTGTAVNALAAAAIKEKGAISAKDDAGLRAEADKMRKDKEVKDVSYLGQGRYKLDYVANREPGKALAFLNIFKVSSDKDGVMTIAATEMKEKDKKQLEQLGMQINGTLNVKLPSNAEVISHNATSTPTFGFGSYSWKIGRIGERPMMKIKFK